MTLLLLCCIYLSVFEYDEQMLKVTSGLLLSRYEPPEE